MTTKVTTVERIDSIEGPNFEGLINPTIQARRIRAKYPDSKLDFQLMFAEVAYFDGNGDRIPEEFDYGLMLRGYLLRLGFIDNLYNPDAEEFDIVIATPFGTFEGRYNVVTRKGTFLPLK